MRYGRVSALIQRRSRQQQARKPEPVQAGPLRGKRDAEAEVRTERNVARRRDHRLHGTACVNEAGECLHACHPAWGKAPREGHKGYKGLDRWRARLAAPGRRTAFEEPGPSEIL